MKSLRSIFATGVMLTVGMLMVQGMYSDADAAKKPKKPKGIVLQEGDRATLTVDSKYTTIVFPDNLTAEDMALYDTDFVGYILNSNGKISSTGGEYAGGTVYYYLHNSTEWLHKGQYDNPATINVTRIKSIKITKPLLRLREFNKEMPLLDNSRDKKNDTGYQDELRTGESRYIFIDITLRD